MPCRKSCQKVEHVRQKPAFSHHFGRPPPFPSIPESDFQQFHTSPCLPVAKCLYFPWGVAAWVHLQNINCTKTIRYMSTVVNTDFYRTNPRFWAKNEGVEKFCIFLNGHCTAMFFGSSIIRAHIGDSTSVEWPCARGKDREVI